MNLTPAQYTFILRMNDTPATGFLVHEDGLIATCYHLLQDEFSRTGVKAGLRLNYKTLDGLIEGTALTTEWVDQRADAALLKIEGDIPPDMQPITLIRSSAVTEGMPFSLAGYAEPDYSRSHFYDFHTQGEIIGRPLRDGDLRVLVLDNKRVFKGLSGGAIYCAPLSGVVGMQSARLNVDGNWGADTAFACTSESIAALAPEHLQLQEPASQTLPSYALSLVNEVSGRSAAIVASDLLLRPHWLRPNEFDPKRRWLGAIPRRREMEMIHGWIGATQPLTGCVVLVGPRGVGKSTLASVYVQQYGVEYIGGVLWANIGTAFDPQQDALPILLRWVRYAYGGSSLMGDGQLKQRISSERSFVCSLLSVSNGAMLVVFDDVHRPEQITSLLDVLPSNANILITAPEEVVATDRAGGRIEHYKVGGFDEQDSYELLRSYLPDIPATDLKELASVFGEMPQALTSIAADLACQPDPAKALYNLVQCGYNSEPVRAAFDLNYDSLPDGEYRHRLQLLAVLAEVSSDFSTAIAVEVWNISPEQAVSSLELLTERAWLQRVPDVSDRWTMNTLVRDYVRELQPDAEATQGAHERYIQAIATYGNDPAVWQPDDPNIAHLLHVGDILVARVPIPPDTPQGTEVPSLDSCAAETMASTVSFLGAAGAFLIAYPQAATRTERWIETYCTINLVLDEPAAAGWGYFALARWYMHSESFERTLHILARIETIARENGIYGLLGYTLLDQATIYRLSGSNEAALQTFDQALGLLIDTQYEDPQLYAIVLIGLASLSLTIARPDQAEPLVEQARALVEEHDLHDEHMSLFISQVSAALLMNQSRHDEALEELERSLHITKRLEDERLLADIEADTGWVHVQRGTYEQAEHYLEQAQQRTDAVPYLHLQPRLRFYQAHLRLATGERAWAEELLEEALQIVLQPGRSDRNVEAQIRAQLGEMYYQRGQTKRALATLQTALELLGEVQNTVTAVNVLNLIGTIFRETKEIEVGLAYFQEKQEQIQALNNGGAQVTLFNWLAILLGDIGNIREAMAYFERAQPLIDRIQNHEERAITYMLSAVLYRMSGDYERGIRELQKAVDIWRRLNDTQRLVEVQITLAETAYMRGRFAEAWDYLETTRPTAEGADYTPIQAGYYNLRGLIAFARQQFAEAQNMFERSADINAKIDNHVLRVSNLTNLAILQLHAQQNLDRSLERLDEALSMAREIGFAPQIANVLSNQGLVKYLLGQKEEAVQCLEESVKVLQEAGVTSDTAGVSMEMLRALAQDMRAEGFSADPRDSLRLLLTTDNWEVTVFIVRARAESLLSPVTEGILHKSIGEATRNGQKVLAGVLRSYRHLLTDSRSYGIDEALIRMKRGPENTAIEFWYAYLQRINRNYNIAFQHINRVIEHDPTNTDALLERGWINRGLGLLDAALQDFTRLEDHNRRDARTFVGMGVVEYERGNYDNAISLLTRALQERTNDAYAYQWRAAGFRALGDNEAALEDLNCAVEHEPRISSHRYWRALTALAMRRFQMARDDLTTVIDLDQSDNELLSFDYLWLGIAYEQLNDRKGARFEWNRGAQLPSNNPWLVPLYDFVAENYGRVLQLVEAQLKRQNLPHMLVTQREHWDMLSNLYQGKPHDIAGEVACRLTEKVSTIR